MIETFFAIIAAYFLICVVLPLIGAALLSLHRR